jgi:pimeloyl-ACP methyl ester carboxylesterase
MLNYKIINPELNETKVFLHGFLESLSMWRTLDLENMPFRSVLIDLPGHGNSNLIQQEINLGKPSIVDCASSALNTLNALNIENYDLIGHSLGGYVAIELHKLKESKRKLCLLNSNFWEDDEAKKLDRNRVIDVVKQNKKFFINEAIPNLFLEEFRFLKFVKELLIEAQEIKSDSIIYYSKAMRDRFSNEKYILENKNLTFILQGERDKIVPKEKTLSYKDLNIKIIENAGHMSHLEKTNEIHDFLKIF